MLVRRHGRYRVVALAVGGLLLVPVGGCAETGADDAAAVVADYVGALRARDGAGVCDLLSPSAQEDVEASTTKACANGILEEELPLVGPLQDVQVWGQQARAVGSGDTVFLARLAPGWRIQAVGCSGPDDRDTPYDCQVSGG